MAVVHHVFPGSAGEKPYLVLIPRKLLLKDVIPGGTAPAGTTVTIHMEEVESQRCHSE
jgi:hypothetical protein